MCTNFLYIHIYVYIDYSIKVSSYFAMYKINVVFQFLIV